MKKIVCTKLKESTLLSSNMTKACFVSLGLILAQSAGAAINWRVIPEDNAYPTDDIIVAVCEVTDADYQLPTNHETEDCSDAFQAALDHASEKGGGTVFVPAGTYQLDKTLYIDSNVTLRGRWSLIDAANAADGTILKLNVTTNSAFRITQHGCGLRDLTFWQPNQTSLSNPIAYPFIISIVPSFNGSGRQATIENVNLVNIYNGIDLSTSSMSHLRGIYGTPLNLGLTADNSAMVSRYDDIHFSPDYWRWANLNLSNTPSQGTINTHLMNNATAIDIREMDGFYFLTSSVSGYHVGIQLAQGDDDDPWGSLGYIDVSNCATALNVLNSKYIKIIDCSFEGSDYGIYAGNNDPSIALTINKTTISGGINSVLVNNGLIKMVNCDLTGSTSVTAPGRLYSSTETPVMPVFNNTYNRERKPGTANLFNVTNSVYEGGANPDGRLDINNWRTGGDDTPAIQAAINAAKAAGGGIVFFPPGQYLVSDVLDLGVGVELRGSSGSRHVSCDRLGDTIGSLIMIDPAISMSTPFITLGDNSGLRGMAFHYLDQSFTSFIPYPYMVLGAGDNNYLIDCYAGNPYKGAWLTGDNHLVEYTSFGGLANSYLAENSTGGRIQNCHIKPDFWFDTMFPGAPTAGAERALYDWNTTRELDAIVIQNCTNYSISSIYNQYSQAFTTVDNSTGQAMMISCERTQYAYTLQGGPKTYDFLACGSTINAVGDQQGTIGINTLLNYSGTARFFAGSLWGASDIAYLAADGHLYMQQCSLGGFGYRGAENLVCFSTGSIDMDACYSAVYLEIENSGALTIDNSLFDEGLARDIAPDYLRTNQNNHIDVVHLVADLNTAPPKFFGLDLDMTDISMVDTLLLTGTPQQGDENECRRIYTAELDSLKSSFFIDVTDADFVAEMNRVSAEILIMVLTNCNIEVYFDGIAAPVKTASWTNINTPTWMTVTALNKPNATFSDPNGKDIEIRVVSGTNPLLAMVAITSNQLPEPSVEEADTTPPSPSPSQFISTSATTTSIDMEAVVASDPNGVEYFFRVRLTNSTVNADTSGWTTNSSYTANNLAPDTAYDVRVRTRDFLGNGGNWSADVTVTTLSDDDTTPPSPNPSQIISTIATDTDIYMEAEVASDPNGVEYFFRVRLPNSTVNADASGWTTNSSYTATGLDPDTAYFVRVRTRDFLGNGGNWSTDVTVTTSVAGGGGGGGWTELNNETFNDDLGTWTSGGVDAFHNDTDQCLRVQDDDLNNGDASSALLTDSLDLSSYSTLKINFDCLPTNLSNGKKLLVKLSTDGGSTWNTIGTYEYNVNIFNNGIQFAAETTTTTSSYFTSSVNIKLESYAGSNQRYFNIDNIVISAQ